MRQLLLLLMILLTSCSTTKTLPSGHWSGYLSPMDQADKRTDLKYLVDHTDDLLSLQIFGPRGLNIEPKEVQMANDTLFFSFDKLDQTGTNTCALRKINKKYYYGRCTDSDDRWAVFTMQHSSIDPTKGGQNWGCPCHSDVSASK